MINMAQLSARRRRFVIALWGKIPDPIHLRGFQFTDLHIYGQTWYVQNKAFLRTPSAPHDTSGVHPGSASSTPLGIKPGATA